MRPARRVRRAAPLPNSVRVSASIRASATVLLLDRRAGWYAGHAARQPAERAKLRRSRRENCTRPRRGTVDHDTRLQLRAPPRDGVINSRNCVGGGGMGRAGLVTTDLISVYAWSDKAGAAHRGEIFGADQADRGRRFVLSYAGRRGDEVVSDNVRAD